MAWSATQLTFAYAQASPTLSNVALEVERGEVVAVVGLNGAGKSTLLQAMIGLLRPSAGSVSLDGQTLESLSISQRAQLLASVLQRESAAFPFRVGEVVAMGRYTHRQSGSATTEHDLSVVRRALAAVEASELEQRRITDLSGGERQRVFLARALAQETPYLALDEPTAFLDVPHQIEFGELVRRLAHERQVGVLWVLHDLNLALRYSDRVAAIADRKILFCGPTAPTIDRHFLRTVFGVDGEIYVDGNGESHVLFHRRLLAR